MAGAQGSALAVAVSQAGGLGWLPCALGTAYLLCPEATTNAMHRAALKSDAARVTAVTNLFTGRPARGIVNRFIRELGPLNPAAPAFHWLRRRWRTLRATAESRGSSDFSPMWAGQNTTGCREQPADVLTRELAGVPATSN